MKIKNVELKYIIDQGLHDSELNDFVINYSGKSVIINVATEKDYLKIELYGIEFLQIDKEDDFKNQEIILDFDVNLEKKTIKIFTTSNTSYIIKFKDAIQSR